MSLKNALITLNVLKHPFSAISIKDLTRVWRDELVRLESPSTELLTKAINDSNKFASAALVLRAVLSPTEENREWVNARLEGLALEMNGQKFQRQLVTVSSAPMRQEEHRDDMTP